MNSKLQVVYGKPLRWDSEAYKLTVKLMDGSLAVVEKDEICLSNSNSSDYITKFVMSIFSKKVVKFHLISKEGEFPKKLSLRSVMLASYNHIDVGDILYLPITNMTEATMFLRHPSMISIAVSRKELTDSFIDDIRNIYKVGQAVAIKIIAKDDSNYFINGSVKALCNDSLENYYEGQILRGRVASKLSPDSSTFFVEISPKVAGLMDVYFEGELPFANNDTIMVKVVRVKEKGLKLNYFSPIEFYDTVSVGDVFTLPIKAINRSSILLDVAEDTTVYVHQNEISNSFIRDISKYFSVGQMVNVKIIDKDDELHWLYGSIKATCNDGLFNYHVGDILRGRIANFLSNDPNSCFVEISPTVYGLIDFKGFSTIPVKLDDFVMVRVAAIKERGLKLRFITKIN